MLMTGGGQTKEMDPVSEMVIEILPSSVLNPIQNLSLIHI